jgi:hypothetical protein
MMNESIPRPKRKMRTINIKTIVAHNISSGKNTPKLESGIGQENIPPPTDPRVSIMSWLTSSWSFTAID